MRISLEKCYKFDFGCSYVIESIGNLIITRVIDESCLSFTNLNLVFTLQDDEFTWDELLLLKFFLVVFFYFLPIFAFGKCKVATY